MAAPAVPGEATHRVPPTSCPSILCSVGVGGKGSEVLGSQPGHNLPRASVDKPGRGHLAGLSPASPCKEGTATTKPVRSYPEVCSNCLGSVLGMAGAEQDALHLRVLEEHQQLGCCCYMGRVVPLKAGRGTWKWEGQGWQQGNLCSVAGQLVPRLAVHLSVALSAVSGPVGFAESSPASASGALAPVPRHLPNQLRIRSPDCTGAQVQLRGLCLESTAGSCWICFGGYCNIFGGLTTLLLGQVPVRTAKVRSEMLGTNACESRG